MEFAPPSEQNPVGSYTLRKKPCGEQDPRKKIFWCLIHAGLSSAGYLTPKTISKIKYLHEFENELENILGCESGGCLDV
jgi:hypothetical protein